MVEAAAGGEWVEAPVLGSIPQADSGTLQVMVGGTAEQPVVERAGLLRTARILMAGQAFVPAGRL